MPDEKPELIYLDHNATSPLLPAVADRMHECQQTLGGNPSSQHAAGRAARRMLESARERAAQMLGASTAGLNPDRLILTSGGTEANNLALRGLLAAGALSSDSSSDPPHLVISAIEHPSVDQTARWLEGQGVDVDRAPVSRDGAIQTEAVRALVRPTTRLVSVMLVSNETGVIQPVREIAQHCGTLGVPVHTDATQGVGKMEVDFAALGVAMMSFSAHKFHGPVGIGGLLARGDIALTPLLIGQPGAERPGTAMVALAAGMETALAAWRDESTPRWERLKNLRDLFEQSVLARVAGTVVVGGGAERAPHASNIAFVGHDRQALAMALDRAGVACSTGSACASGSSEPSPTLQAMGLDEEVVRGSLRFSLGAMTTKPQIVAAVERIAAVCQRTSPSEGG